MDDQVRLDALNHIEDKIKIAKLYRDSAMTIEDKIVWSRMIKRYKILRDKMFK